LQAQLCACKDTKFRGGAMGNKHLDSQEIKAYMGEDAVFQGVLTFSGAVRVDGRLEGEVHTEDTLIVGEKGVLQADITAGTVVCKGKITGSIKATKQVEIYANSEVVGNIETPSLFIEVGALFDGNCNMSSNESKIIKLVPEEETGLSSSG